MSHSTRSPASVLYCSLGTIALVAAAYAAFHGYRSEEAAWVLVSLALLLSIWWQRGIELNGTALEGPSGPSTHWRRLLGVVLALAGAALWVHGTTILSESWQKGFDGAWVSWVTGTVLLGVGLDLLWARWRGGRPRWKVAAPIAAVVGVGALLRLGTFYFFPAPYHVTQVEELQVGALGMEMLNGSRIRWEYLSQSWLGALGITVGGPSLLSIRLPSTIISFLKIAPLFLLLRFSVGNTGAIVGSLLLAVSSWDTTFARVATNHNVLVVLLAFALLAGPARRGRPSAYVWLGLFSGYVFYEYVLYRPLAVFVVLGAIMTSLRDRHAAWPARLLRPLITIALLGAMTWPLYNFIVDNGRTREFYDGYGRAIANNSYYQPDDEWAVTLQKRASRTRQALSLLFFRGADSPVTNPRADALVDPFTSLLLVIGSGYALAHPLRQIFGLTFVAGVATYAASLVLTGNFDFVRAGSALGYVFAIAGFGAAALAEGLRRGGLERRRVLVGIALGGGVLFAALFSLRHLAFFVSDPSIQRAQFRDLAYLTAWVRANSGAGERTIVAAPNFPYLMENHDAAWMRGSGTRGASFWDLQSALTDWAQHPEPTVLMLYGAGASAGLQKYLGWLLPTASFTLEPGPIGPEKDLLYIHAAQPPPELQQRLARWDCQPVAIEVDLLDAGGRVLTTVVSSAGLIDPTLWPGSVQLGVLRLRPQVTAARARFVADFRVEKGGDYIFPLEVYPGAATLEVDSIVVPSMPTTAVRLEPGLHHLDLRTDYDPNASAPLVRLFWQGPDTGPKRELLPFYRIAPERCPPA